MSKLRRGDEAEENGPQSEQVVLKGEIRGEKQAGCDSGGVNVGRGASKEVVYGFRGVGTENSRENGEESEKWVKQNSPPLASFQSAL